MTERPPLNVVLVSLIIFLQGIVMLIFGILTMLFWLQLRALLDVTHLLFLLSTTPETFLPVFGSNIMLASWVQLNVFRFVFLITWSGFSIVVFYTFSSLKPWAYQLAIIQSIVSFLLSALLLVDLMAIPLIAANILVLIYLLVSEEIKDTFLVT